MKAWKSVLKSDSVEWLLEVSNPSIRYFALIDLVDKHFSNNAVKAAKAEIMKVGPVPKILSKQNVKGYWIGYDKFYSAKYKGAVWQLIILAELGADGDDERVRKACEFILENSQDRESGVFPFGAAFEKPEAGIVELFHA